MPFLIDGHNLIPKVPGLSLEKVDDEIALFQMLQQYARLAQKDIVVIFDKAPTGQPGHMGQGRAKAFFARQGTTADDEIRKRLRQLGGSAKNWTVVTSDRQVLADVRAVGAKIVKSEEFAVQLQDMLASDSSKPAGSPAGTDQDLQEWLDLFSSKKPGDKPS